MNQVLTQQEIRSRILGVMEKHAEVCLCYIYGSVANGRAGHRSDVDIAVACRELMTPRDRMYLQEELAVALNCDVDLLDLSRATGTILRNALRGQCILCRATSVRYDTVRRLVYDQEDMQPLRRRLMKERRERFICGY